MADEAPITDDSATVRLDAGGASPAPDREPRLPPTSDPQDAEDPATDPWIGRRVGPYLLTALLGRGGMGSVYAASRADGVYEQQVAVKIVHRALASANSALRFRQERQILARLDHPNIARILDGGVTDDHVPYLAMELIAGDTICQFADRETLSVERRVDLFLEVCRAVESAHRQLVVHRDLKPANVLVKSDGEVKLLDFGIAKLLDAGGDAEPHTRTGLVVMTPSYASPEQILGDTIGTATDVYALGLILFELLVGAKAQQVTDTSPTGLIESVCGRPIPEPSRAIFELPSEEAEARAQQRSVSPARWRRQVTGDLDVIVGRCLRKEPERRYGSAGELAQDLERYRSGLPVEARPDSLAYRSRKLVGRHRTAFLAATLTLTALVVGLVLAVGGMLRARDAERRMADEALAARQTADFLVQLFQVGDPKERSEAPSARTLLDRAFDSMDSDLDASPEVRARLLGTLGRVYANLGAFDRAVTVHERQLQALGTAHSDASAFGLARAQLAEALCRTGDPDRARAEAEGGLADLRAAGQSDSLAAGRVLTSLGIATWMLGDYETARGHLQRALELRQEHQDSSEAWQIQILNNLAILEVELGRLAEAREHYQSALRQAEELWSADSIRVAPTLNNLALLERADERFDQAEAYHRRALGLRESHLGADHPDVAESLNNLGDLLDSQKRYDEARGLLDRALAIRLPALGPTHPWTLTVRFNLALNQSHTGQLAAARAAFEELLPIFVEVFGSEHSYTSHVFMELASIDLAEGRLDAALEHGRQALAIRIYAHGAEHRLTVQARDLIAEIEEATAADGSGRQP